MAFSFFKSEGILTTEKKIRIIVTTCLAALIAISMLYQVWENRAKVLGLTVAKNENPTNVTLPSIINGNLVIPKDKEQIDLALNNLIKDPNKSSLLVLSANLIGVFDNSTGESKLTGIRVIGEAKNIGDKIVYGFIPVLRFIDGDNKVKEQKIGAYSEGYHFRQLEPKEVNFYDFTVLNIPSELTEKVEVVFSAQTEGENKYEQIGIEGRDFEVKIASNSATGEIVEYYSVSGSIFNIFEDYITDIIVDAWVKDKDGFVFATSSQVFKNDLLPANEKLAFRIPLIPLKNGYKYESYGLSAWGRRFKLN